MIKILLFLFLSNSVFTCEDFLNTFYNNSHYTQDFSESVRMKLKKLPFNFQFKKQYGETELESLRNALYLFSEDKKLQKELADNDIKLIQFTHSDKIVYDEKTNFIRIPYSKYKDSKPSTQDISKLDFTHKNNYQIQKMLSIFIKRKLDINSVYNVNIIRSPKNDLIKLFSILDQDKYKDIFSYKSFSSIYFDPDMHYSAPLPDDLLGRSIRINMQWTDDQIYYRMMLEHSRNIAYTKYFNNIDQENLKDIEKRRVADLLIKLHNSDRFLNLIKTHRFNDAQIKHFAEINKSRSLNIDFKISMSENKVMSEKLSSVFHETNKNFMIYLPYNKNIDIVIQNFEDELFRLKMKKKGH